MSLKHLNNEVLVAETQIVKIERQDIESLKKKAVQNQRQRARICTHIDVDDALHEMLIVLTKNVYVRPHKHLNKSESFHTIEGSVDVVLFDEEGNIAEIIPMSDYASGQRFYYRISGPFYHTFMIKSDFLVFHETTKGPFRRADTIFAPWAPDENDGAAAKEFMAQLARAVEEFVPLHQENI